MAACQLSPHEAWVLAHATHFTAYAFGGRGIVSKIQCPDRAEAKCEAKRLAQANERGAVVYAVYRNHQALLDTYQKGTVMDMEHHLITWVADSFRVQSFPDAAGLKRAIERVEEEQRRLAVSEPNDLKALANGELVALRNHLSVGKPIKLFQSKEKGIASVWSLLSTRKESAVESAGVPEGDPMAIPAALKREPDPASDAKMAETIANKGKRNRRAKQTEVSESFDLAASSTLTSEPVSGTDAESTTTDAGAPAAAVETEDEMAKSKKRAAKAKAPKKSKGNGELRAGSKQEALWKVISRKGGATVAEMLAATGWKEARGTAKALATRFGKTLERIEEEGKKARYAAV